MKRFLTEMHMGKTDFFSTISLILRISREFEGRAHKLYKMYNVLNKYKKNYLNNFYAYKFYYLERFLNTTYITKW